MPIEHDAIPKGPQQPVVWATILEGPLESLERGLEIARGQLLAVYETQPGWQGAVGLISFDGRRSMLLNFWQNEETAQEANAESGRLRQGAASLGLKITSSDRFEILFDDRLE